MAFRRVISKVVDSDPAFARACFAGVGGLLTGMTPVAAGIAATGNPAMGVARANDRRTVQPEHPTQVPPCGIIHRELSTVA